jgi:hypothetical protein
MLVAGFELSKSYHFGQSIPSHSMDIALYRHRMQRIVTVFVGVIVSVLATLFKQAHQSITMKIPYHTSILTSEGWVLELLTGHPRRIRTELGVSHVVFDKLISTLRSMGLHSSYRVSLEEQWSIFLYASVTGLSVRHLGERFQWSNDTISQWVNLKTKKHILSLYFSYFRLILIFLSSPPFYMTYVRLPTVDDPYPPEILNNPKFWPFFWDAIGALDRTHISASPPAFIRMDSRIAKASYRKIASLHVTSTCYSYTRCVDGKDLWWMHLYIRMHRCMTWQFLKVNITLLIQGIHLVRAFSFLTVVCTII